MVCFRFIKSYDLLFFRMRVGRVNKVVDQCVRVSDCVRDVIMKCKSEIVVREGAV